MANLRRFLIQFSSLFLMILVMSWVRRRVWRLNQWALYELVHSVNSHVFILTVANYHFHINRLILWWCCCCKPRAFCRTREDQINTMQFSSSSRNNMHRSLIVKLIVLFKVHAASRTGEMKLATVFFYHFTVINRFDSTFIGLLSSSTF